MQLSMKFISAIILLSVFISSCSLQKKIARSAKANVLETEGLSSAHVGISIYEPATNKFWYNYQGDHFFVPASNTKLATCYAAMKYLGDSLTGITMAENDTAVFFVANGDPTTLNAEYISQPVLRFFQNTKKKIYTSDYNWQDNGPGSGWAWNDYNETYMAERSPFPVYGNLIKWIQEIEDQTITYSIPEVNWQVNLDSGIPQKKFSVVRARGENIFDITEGEEKKKEISVPFVTGGIKAALELLPDTIHSTVSLLSAGSFKKIFNSLPHQDIHSIPTDSLLRPMMHRSDNFFAEQCLMMVSNKLLGVMNDEEITDTLLKTDFTSLPQKPVWADGCGLSRYNLFTPQDMVFILNKMRTDFGMERIKNVLATGNTGTLTNYYKAENGYVFAKTGTLSGVVCLSGFLYTKKNKLIIFSVLVNNQNGSASAVRRAVEKFVEAIRNGY
jgi:D-alanyl-D-alanine carboxypeptidase/D-alanyl-D-alanine-endopeptidase (penicillin-binding protein 4)